MKYEIDRRGRRSIRLRDYDYSEAGAYFVTICIQHKECLLGDIADDCMALNAFGAAVQECWDELPRHFPHVELDEFVAMPNHVHGIILLNSVAAQHAAPHEVQHAEPLRKNVSPGSLGAIVRSFKSAATKRINEMRGMPGVPVWQRNYYEHVVRDDNELNRIRQYIMDNPAQWALDRENPAAPVFTPIRSQHNAPQRPLPPGWRWVWLGEVCEVNPARPNLNRADNVLTSFVPMTAVEECGRGIASIEQRPYGEMRKGYTYFAEGDVIFAKITPCMQNGKHAIVRALINGVGFGSTEFHVLRPKNEIISEWIHRFVLQPWVIQLATAHFTGAVGQQRVPETFLAGLEIPLPSLPEQRRIVAILSEQMAAVEQARTATETQLEAATALPAAYLRAVFNSPGAQQWPRVWLGEVVREAQGGFAIGERDPIGVIQLRMNNVTSRGDFDWSSFIRVPTDTATIAAYRLQCGDVLFNNTNSTDLVGKSALFESFEEPVVFSNHFTRLRVFPEKIEPRFLALWLREQWQQRVFANICNRWIGQSAIQRDKLLDLKIPLPPLPEQRRIVAILSEQMADVEKARKALEGQLEAINRLPSALLRRAFNGEI